MNIYIDHDHDIKKNHDIDHVRANVKKKKRNACTWACARTGVYVPVYTDLACIYIYIGQVYNVIM